MTGYWFIRSSEEFSTSTSRILIVVILVLVLIQ